MADEILVSCTDLGTIGVPEWDRVVGDKTIENGGKVGDLMLLTRAHIKDAKKKGEITEKTAGDVYSTMIAEAMRNAITFELGLYKAQLETCLLKTQIGEINKKIERDDCLAQSECALKEAQKDEIPLESARRDCETQSKVELNEAQKDEIPLESARRDCETQSECALKEAQKDKIIYETDNVLPKEIEKLEATVDNIEATTTEIGVASERDNCRAEHECALKDQQIEKYKCDCANSTMLNTAQTALYNRQAEGFDDNAKQKLYDTQLQAWAMVFSDTSLESVTPSISTPHITDTYNNLAERLGNKFKAPLLDYSEDDVTPDKLKFDYQGSTNIRDISRFKTDTLPLKTMLSVYGDTNSDDITFKLYIVIDGTTYTTDGTVNDANIEFAIDSDSVANVGEGTYSIQGSKDDDTWTYASGKITILDDAE